MVESDIARRGIVDERVLDAMSRVPREAFVPASLRRHAYDDAPLPIAAGQTISQPFIVARMIAALALRGGERVLDVGTGSGYAAAVLSLIATRVYTIERHGELHEMARRRFERLGYDNIEARHGDGTDGWPEEAPFEAIHVAAAARSVPSRLVEQLSEGGRLIVPVGRTRLVQRLVRVTREEDGRVRKERLDPVRFVPLVERGDGERR